LACFFKMGIKGLTKLISDYAPSAMKESDIKAYFGLKVAVDASMSLYQFLIAIRHGAEAQQLTNEAGDVTSHLTGMFYRTLRLLELGIKPVFVFDGKPPDLKKGEVAKRRERKEQAEQDLKEAQEAENQEEINKYQRRLVRVTKEQNDDVKRLLTLLGVPIVEAPCEAEAQCAVMCSAGLVFATATEDTDALTFGTTKLLRNLTAPASRKLPVVEFDLPTVLEQLQLDIDQFVDMCILCGCDYTDSIYGVGPARALEFIRKYKNIDNVLKNIDTKKFKVPEVFQHAEAHAFFRQPLVTPPDEIKLVWKDHDEEGLIEFLVNEKQFNLDRVKAGLKRLTAAKAKGLSSQKRMESFFTVLPKAKKPEGSAESKPVKAAKSALKGSVKGGKGSAKKAGEKKKEEEKKETKKKATSTKESQPKKKARKSYF